jgi:hypothetical protein
MRMSEPLRASRLHHPGEIQCQLSRGGVGHLPCTTHRALRGPHPGSQEQRLRPRARHRRGSVGRPTTTSPAWAPTAWSLATEWFSPPSAIGRDRDGHDQRAGRHLRVLLQHPRPRARWDGRNPGRPVDGAAKVPAVNRALRTRATCAIHLQVKRYRGISGSWEPVSQPARAPTAPLASAVLPRPLARSAA